MVAPPLLTLDLSTSLRRSDFPFIAAIRGRVGNRVFKTYGDKIVVSRVPCFAGYLPTTAQRARRDRIRETPLRPSAAKAFYTAVAHTLGRQPFRLGCPISDEYFHDS